MHVRYPSFDLSGLGAHWAPNRGWAHHINATGTIPSAIEPFLIKVMRRAKADLDPVVDAELIADVDTFNKQEAQHYKLHGQFNEAVANDGFPDLLKHDARLKAEYAEMLETRSLEWLLGYCEAFESIVAVGVSQWVDLGWGEYLTGADPRVVALWRWHLAEEYEHRTVVHRLFHRVVSGTPEEQYQKRIECLNFFLEHLATHVGATVGYLLEVERQGMSEEERAASIARSEAIDELSGHFHLPVAGVMQPDWDPTTLPKPRLLDEAFALVS
jgi:uncharacterized protein